MTPRRARLYVMEDLARAVVRRRPRRRFRAGDAFRPLPKYFRCRADIVFRRPRFRAIVFPFRFPGPLTTNRWGLIKNGSPPKSFHNRFVLMFVSVHKKQCSVGLQNHVPLTEYQPIQTKSRVDLDIKHPEHSLSDSDISRTAVNEKSFSCVTPKKKTHFPP